MAVRKLKPTTPGQRHKIIGTFEAVSYTHLDVYKRQDKYNVPRIAYVNKMDRSGADFFEVVRDVYKRQELDH